VRYESCPQARIPAAAIAAVRFEEFSRRGLLPVAGGLLDQTAAGLDALEHVAAESAAWRAKLRIPEAPW
jgi:hypothetical protein